MRRYDDDFSNSSLKEPAALKAGRGRKRQGRRESERRMNRFLFLLFCVGALALGTAYFAGGYALDVPPAPAEAASSTASTQRVVAAPILAGLSTLDSAPLDKDIPQYSAQGKLEDIRDEVSDEEYQEEYQERDLAGYLRDVGDLKDLTLQDDPPDRVELAQAQSKAPQPNSKAQTKVSQPKDLSQSKAPPKTPAPAAASKGRWILIDKGDYKLTLYNGNNEEKRYDVAVGKNPGDKQKVGDNRTPIGDFTVQSVENASHWTHDFKDGKGVIAGAYGPWFIRLKTGKWRGIGIHGTHNPSSIGTMATEGCIRLKNEDLKELKPLVRVGMRVKIQE